MTIKWFSIICIEGCIKSTEFEGLEEISILQWFFDLIFLSLSVFFNFLMINKSKPRSSPRKSKMSHNTLLSLFPSLSYVEYSHPYTDWQLQKRRSIWWNYTQSSKSKITQDRQRIFSPYPRRYNRAGHHVFCKDSRSCGSLNLEAWFAWSFHPSCSSCLQYFLVVKNILWTSLRSKFWCHF